MAERTTGAAPNAAVVLLLALTVAGAAVGGFLLGSRDEPPAEPTWPSYAEVFGEVAGGVVNVSLETPSARIGSGFVVSPREVVTARHLVVDAERVTVRDIHGRTLGAEVVGTDARTDLALLRLTDGELVPLELGSTADLRVGDTVVAIGNPFGLGHSLSVGVVGSRGRRLAAEVEDGPRVDFLQLSLPLNPGNSGGPVFDASGRVVGVLSGTHSQGQAISFAVPVEALLEDLGPLRAGARVSRAFLGVTTRAEAGAVVVDTVIPSSPADRAGIRPGDSLTAFDGAELSAPVDLQRALDRLEGGRATSVRLLRDGELHVLDVTLADWAEQPVAIGGMILRPAPGAGGEVVAVRPRSRAERSGVRVGDVVRAVDGVPVRAPADVRDALGGGGPAQLDLVRGGAPLSVQLEEAG